METGAQFLARLDDAAQALAQSALALPFPVLLGAACIPIVAAAFCRSGTGIVAAGVFTASALLSLAHDAGVAILAYSGAVLASLYAHGEAHRRRATAHAQEEIALLRRENQAFLDALDRRAQLMDKASASAPGRTKPEHAPDRALSEVP